MNVSKRGGSGCIFPFRVTGFFLSLSLSILVFGCGGGMISESDDGGNGWDVTDLFSVQDDQTSVDPRARIVLTFGREVDTTSVEENFSAEATSGERHCSWRWSEDQTTAIIFCALSYCDPDVVITVGPNAEDAEGNRLGDNSSTPDGASVTFETKANPGDADGASDCKADLILSRSFWETEAAGGGMYRHTHSSGWYFFAAPSGEYDLGDAGAILEDDDYEATTDDEEPPGEMLELIGASAALTGDLDGDLLPDILIGAPYVGSAVGEVGMMTAALQLETSWGGEEFESGEPWFGSGVRDAGDVNADGYGDFVVGLMYPQSPLVLFGGSGVSAVGQHDVELDVEYVLDIAGGADINGDSIADVVTSGFKWEEEALSDGAVDVFLGSASFSGASAMTISDASGNDMSMFGFSVSAADVNGDSYADILVGAPVMSTIGVNNTYIFFGTPQLPSAITSASADVTIEGEMGSYFGYDVGAAGDVNGDGYEDILISAPVVLSQRGAVYLFLGRETGDWSSRYYESRADYIIYGTENPITPEPDEDDDPALRSQIARAGGVGDVNNDGYDDFAVYGYWDVFIFYGARSYQTTWFSTAGADAIIEGGVADLEVPDFLIDVSGRFR